MITDGSGLNAARRDPRQQRILDRLRLVGAAPAQAYEDTLTLISESQRLHTASHLAGHLAREINGAIRSVFGAMRPAPPAMDYEQGADSSEPERKDKYWESIQASAGGLGIPLDSGLLRLWWEVGEAFIGGRVHRVHLSGWRQVDDEFRLLWDKFESVLDKVLDRFVARITAAHGVVDEILGAGPTDDSVRRLREEVPHNPIALQDFYSRATVEWLSGLRDGGFFQHPPPPVVDEEGRTLFPSWPAIEYLERIAATSSPEVADLIANCPGTENGAVHAGLARVICLIAEANAAPLTETATRWLTNGVVTPQLVESLTDLAQRLGAAGYSSEALALTRVLLALDQRSKG